MLSLYQTSLAKEGEQQVISSVKETAAPQIQKQPSDP